MLDDYDFDGSQRSYYIWDIVDEKLNEAPFITYTDNAREKREQFKMLAQEQYEGDTK